MLSRKKQQPAKIIKSSVSKAPVEWLLLYEFLEKRFKVTLTGKRKESLNLVESSLLADYLKVEASDFTGINHEEILKRLKRVLEVLRCKS